jgi:hypothetical protein
MEGVRVFTPEDLDGKARTDGLQDPLFVKIVEKNMKFHLENMVKVGIATTFSSPLSPNSIHMHPAASVYLVT